MYSLLNIAALVRDLGRHPRAEQVATELLRAFAIGAGELELLDQLHYDENAQAQRRARVLAADAARPRALQVLAAARGFADELGIGAYAAAADVLEQTPIGDLDALRGFLRREVLADAWIAVGDVAVARWPRSLDVVTDGVLGVHAGDAELAAPWRVWTAQRGIGPEATAWPEGAMTALRASATATTSPSRIPQNATSMPVRAP